MGIFILIVYCVIDVIPDLLVIRLVLIYKLFAANRFTSFLLFLICWLFVWPQKRPVACCDLIRFVSDAEMCAAFCFVVAENLDIHRAGHCKFRTWA